MKEIFISYAREDHAWVEKLVRVLQSEGLSVWWDRTIAPGRTWDEVIEEALDAARCVIVVWSRTSVKSKWVRTEADEGQRRGILFPVFIDDCIAPLEFRRIQGAQLSGWDGSPHDPDFRLLVQSLHAVIQGQAVVPPDAAGTIPSDATDAPATEVREERRPYETEDETAPRANTFRFAAGLAVTLGLVAFFVWWMQEPAFEASGLRMGLLMKDTWIDAEALQVYDAVVERFNKRTAELGLTVDENVRVFRRAPEIIDALERDEIELAGELSPRDIAQAGSVGGAKPFVSPLYGGSHHYTSVFFVSREYVDRNDLDPAARSDVWEQVVRDLAAADGSASVAVSDRGSTSGYWYPRYELIRALGGRRSFDEIGIKQKSYKDLFKAVENGYNGVIVGAIAKFRFCDPDYVDHETREECQETFVRLDDTSQIPQGGFVLRDVLYAYLDSQGMMHRWQNAWKYSVEDVTQGRSELDPEDGHKKKYLPATWAGVSDEDYAKAREVFKVQDAAAVHEGQVTRRLVATGVAIIVLVSAVFLWLRRPSAGNVAG